MSLEFRIKINDKGESTCLLEKSKITIGDMGLLFLTFERVKQQLIMELGEPDEFKVGYGSSEE